MNDREQEYNRYLRKIAENLDISESMRDKAVNSYTAVGKWLGDCAEDSTIKITPQGSFCLGTVIKPITDKDEYDIDLVCLMKDKHSASEYEIKNTVGDRLKEHGKYAIMMDKEEGKRCWTLHYDEFHMDILPCVPKETVYIEPNSTSIRLAHKVAPLTYIPKFSNPYKYHDWFEQRMLVKLMEAKKEYSARNQVDITNVPLYKVKTPLQRAIQMLKRHRDIMYQDAAKVKKDNAPISIIITTLAAHAYNNESNVFEALKNILNNIYNYIEVRDGEYWIENPAMSEENFAENWNAEPKKQEEFVRWVDRAMKEILIDPLEKYGLHNFSESLQRSFGSNIVQKSFLDLGYQTKLDREKGELYVSGLTSGLTTSAGKGAKKVGDHTFYGI